MPWSSPTPCRYRGCGKPCRGGYCDAHRQAAAQQEAKRMEERIGKPASRGYDHEWRKRKAEVLARYPMCRCGRKATMVHHVQSIATGGARLDPGNLEPLCWPCHAMTHRGKHP